MCPQGPKCEEVALHSTLGQVPPVRAKQTVMSTRNNMVGDASRVCWQSTFDRLLDLNRRRAHSGVFFANDALLDTWL